MQHGLPARLRRYNSLKMLLKSAPATPATTRDDARHIRAAINRRLTPPQADVYAVRHGRASDRLRARATRGGSIASSNRIATHSLQVC
jgi:hypothetical protein